MSGSKSVQKTRHILRLVRFSV